MSIDNVQARAEDGRIEIGLFEGEECREVIALRAPEAFELRDSLNDALREAGLLDRRTAASEQHAVGLSRGRPRCGLCAHRDRGPGSFL